MCMCAWGTMGRLISIFVLPLELARQIPLSVLRLADLCENLTNVCEFEGQYQEVIQFVEKGKQLLSDSCSTIQ